MNDGMILMPRGYDANRTGLSQDLLLRIGMWSRCNVSLQQYVEHTRVATSFRAFCNVCKKAKQFRYEDFVQAIRCENTLKDIQTFCEDHAVCGQDASIRTQLQTQNVFQVGPYVRTGVIPRKIRVSF